MFDRSYKPKPIQMVSGTRQPEPASQANQADHLPRRARVDLEPMSLPQADPEPGHYFQQKHAMGKPITPLSIPLQLTSDRPRPPRSAAAQSAVIQRAEEDPL